VLGALALAPAASAGASQDTAATHAYLTSAYKTLHTSIARFGEVGKNVQKLDAKYSSECSHVGAGSPQSEEEQHMSYEVFGAIEATGYDTLAGVVEGFSHTVKPLKWSNATVTRDARQFAASLEELVELPLPDLCGDVRAWHSGGYGKVPSSTLGFDEHLEDIEGAPVPWKLLAKYTAPGDKALAGRDAKLYTQLTNLETVRGQDWWNATLKALALDQ
jgi:hypothetical protein